MRRHAHALLCLALLLASCRTWPPTLAGVRPHESLDAVLWMQSSAEYTATAEQAFHQARIQLDRALAPGNEDWTAAVEQTAAGYEKLPPAVVMDLDEVIFDTSRFQAANVKAGRSFDPADWKRWVEEHKAPAVPGSLAFADYARRKGVRLYYVTNRKIDEKRATLQNLQERGFPVDDDGANLLMRAEEPGWMSDKSSRRSRVAETHRIVLLVGDDLNDFVSGSRGTPEARLAVVEKQQSYWGTRWILLPNMVYGGWERAVYDFDSSLTHDEILRRKFEALEVDE